MPFDHDDVLGLECYLYRNTGTDATPVWVLMERVKDVNVDPASKGKAEQKSRASKWNYKRGTHKELGLSFGYDYAPGTDEDYAALLDSFLNGTPIQFAAMDGPIDTEGSQGWKAVMEVFECPLAQEMDNTAGIEISAEITRVSEGGSLVEPEWFEVPATP